MEIQRDQSVSKPSGVTANPLPARKMREVAPERRTTQRTPERRAAEVN